MKDILNEKQRLQTINQYRELLLLLMLNICPKDNERKIVFNTLLLLFSKNLINVRKIVHK